MARLAAEPAGSDNIGSNDAARMGYMRQNREIAKSNSALSIRIRQLEQEKTSLISENLTLKEENLRLSVALERRNKAEEFLDSVSATKRRLQDGVRQLNDLLNDLTPRGYGSDRSSRSPQFPIRRPSQRSTDVPEGFLPSIIEDRRRSSVSELIPPRRGSLNFDDIQLLHPTPQVYNDSDEDSDDSAPACMIDTRPRRRRDSSAVTPLQPPPNLVSSPKSPTPKGASKRKFIGQEVSPTLGSPELDFKFSKVSERAASAARRLSMEVEKTRTPAKRRERGSDDEARDGDHRSSPTERPAKASRTTTGNTIRSSSSSSTSSSSISSSTSSSRRALGPKSTNMDPLNSPVKQAAAAVTASAGYTKPDKPHANEIIPTPTAPRMRMKDTPPPDSAEPTTGTGRTSRRARSNVSYAEPSLRVKMRREDPKAVDAIKGDPKSRRSTSSITPEPLERSFNPRAKLESQTPKIKPEPQEPDNEWLSTAPIAREPIKRPHKVMFDTREEEIPEPAIVHRRRRTSALVTPAAEMEKEETRNRRNSIAVNPTSRSEKRSFSAEGMGGEEEGKRKEERTARRRSMLL